MPQATFRCDIGPRDIPGLQIGGRPLRIRIESAEEQALQSVASNRICLASFSLLPEDVCQSVYGLSNVSTYKLVLRSMLI